MELNTAQWKTDKAKLGLHFDTRFNPTLQIGHIGVIPWDISWVLVPLCQLAGGLSPTKKTNISKWFPLKCTNLAVHASVQCWRCAVLSEVPSSVIMLLDVDVAGNSLQLLFIPYCVRVGCILALLQSFQRHSRNDVALGVPGFTICEGGRNMFAKTRWCVMEGKLHVAICHLPDVFDLQNSRQSGLGKAAWWSLV